MSGGRNNDYMKRRLADALKKRMQSKPLDKITIHQLADDCNVNRQTFYYHFSDIYDLVKWMYAQEIVLLMKNGEDADTWKESLMIFFRYLDENMAVCRCTMNSAGYKHLRSFFHEIIFGIVKRYTLFFTNGIHVEEDFLDFVMDFYTISIGSVAESYVSGELTQTPEQLVQYMERIIENQKSTLKFAE